VIFLFCVCDAQPDWAVPPMSTTGGYVSLANDATGNPYAFNFLEYASRDPYLRPIIDSERFFSERGDEYDSETDVRSARRGLAHHAQESHHVADPPTVLSTSGLAHHSMPSPYHYGLEMHSMHMSSASGESSGMGASASATQV